MEFQQYGEDGEKQRKVPRIRIRYMRLTNLPPVIRSLFFKLSDPFMAQIFPIHILGYSIDDENL
jgi:hypothetical protein